MCSEQKIKTTVFIYGTVISFFFFLNSMPVDSSVSQVFFHIHHNIPDTIPFSAILLQLGKPQAVPEWVNDLLPKTKVSGP